MRYAILSDIHANQQALDACLNDAHHRGVDRLVFLGDLVGYGADVVPVVQRISDLVRDSNAIVVRGNHDDAIDGDASYMNDSAHAAIEYARSVLGEEEKAFLRALPLVVKEGEVCFVHGSAHAPERYLYVDSPTAAEQCAQAADSAYCFCGHVHDQRLYFAPQGNRMTLFRPTPGQPVPTPAHRRWVGIVGSVGQPRDRNPRAAYTIFDATARRTLFVRVAYDHFAAARAIRNAGLPENLASRVEHGY